MLTLACCYLLIAFPARGIQPAGTAPAVDVLAVPAQPEANPSYLALQAAIAKAIEDAEGLAERLTVLAEGDPSAATAWLPRTDAGTDGAKAREAVDRLLQHRLDVERYLQARDDIAMHAALQTELFRAAADLSRFAVEVRMARYGAEIRELNERQQRDKDSLQNQYDVELGSAINLWRSSAITERQFASVQIALRDKYVPLERPIDERVRAELQAITDDTVSDIEDVLKWAKNAGTCGPPEPFYVELALASIIMALDNAPTRSRFLLHLLNYDLHVASSLGLVEGSGHYRYLPNGWAPDGQTCWDYAMDFAPLVTFLQDADSDSNATSDTFILKDPDSWQPYIEKADKLVDLAQKAVDSFGGDKNVKELAKAKELSKALRDLQKALSPETSDEEKKKLVGKYSWKLVKKGMKSLGVSSVCIAALEAGFAIGTPIGGHAAMGIERAATIAAERTAIEKIMGMDQAMRGKDFLFEYPLPPTLFSLDCFSGNRNGYVLWRGSERRAYIVQWEVPGVLAAIPGGFGDMIVDRVPKLVPIR